MAPIAPQSMLQAIAPYIGRPYCAQTFDCADLVQLVQRELFGRDLAFPGKRLGVAGRVVTMRLMQDTLAEPVDQPDTGDVALFTGGPSDWHLGVVCMLPQGLRVLHNSKIQQGVCLWSPETFIQIGQVFKGFLRCK